MNTYLKDTRLSWKAKGLLFYMLSKGDGWIIDMTELLAAATDGREAVHSALAELKQLSYVRHWKGRDLNGRYVWSSIISAKPLSEDIPAREVFDFVGEY